MRTLVLLGVAATALAFAGCGRIAAGMARTAFRGAARTAAPEVVTFRPAVKLGVHGGARAAPELVTFRPLVKVEAHGVAEAAPPAGGKLFVPAVREPVVIRPNAGAPGARGAGRAAGEGGTTRGGARPAAEESVGARIADEIAKELIQQIAGVGADSFQEPDRDRTPLYSLPLPPPPRRTPETIPSRPTTRAGAPLPPPPAP